MSAPQNVIALIFDFDDTLTDESTTKLLEAHGIDTKEFWGTKQSALVAAGWDPVLAYLKLILDETREGRPLEKLTNKALTEFGATLNCYQGIPEVFDELTHLVRAHTTSNPHIEFYIISSGLEDIIRGIKCAKYFNGIWGCRFSEENGKIAGIKNVISFTEKTKYIYSINKGNSDIRKIPYSVNEFVKPENRRIPFENIIYIGDGFTDVPCFSMLNAYGGAAFGVFDPGKIESSKKAWEKLVTPRRVLSMNSPKYGKNDELGALLRVAVTNVCLNMELRMRTALGG